MEITVHVEPGTSELPAVEYCWDADASERTIHFRFGAARSMRAVRVAQDLIFDVDDSSHIAGVWLLNVPPFPTDQ